jgi:hypothetical protein
VPDNILDDLPRLAIAWWAALAAAAAAIAGFYKLLFKYTELVPHNVDGMGTLTVLVNICVFVGLDILFAVVCTGVFSGLFSLEEANYFTRLLMAVGNILLGFWLRLHFPANHLLHVAGLLCYVMAVILVTPLHGKVREHKEIFMSASFFLGAAYFVFGTDLHIFIWKFVTSAPDFRVVPSSLLGFWGWLSTIIGAAAYLGIYALFQIWYTKGKWWQQLRHPDS